MQINPKYRHTNELYYFNPKFEIGHKDYVLYICEGIRGRGKTTWWLQVFTEDAVATGKTFCYLRRSEKELELALEKGLYNSCQSVDEFKEFWSKYKEYKVIGGDIFLYDFEGNAILVGHCFTLNNIKGISIEDSDKLLFDEYVVSPRSKYKGGENGANEPDLFLKLVETLFRRRDFWCVLLGNSDIPTNPYNEYFHIPFGSNLYKDKSRGIWYEYDYSQATIDHKATTSLGRISKGTTYDGYSRGFKSLADVPDELIAEKPSHAKQFYNVRMFGSTITVWIDEVNDVCYLSGNCKINNQYRIISVTNSDMSINTDFLKYNLNFIAYMKAYYGVGRMRFDTQKTGSLFLTMLSIQ